MRRSNRLIESPWLHNRPKKGPVYINLEEGQEIVFVHDSSGKKELSDGRGLAAAVSDSRGLAVAADMINEWKSAGVGNNNDFSDEDTDFRTPMECFDNSKKKVNSEKDSAALPEESSKGIMLRSGKKAHHQMKSNKRPRQSEVLSHLLMTKMLLIRRISTI